MRNALILAASLTLGACGLIGSDEAPERIEGGNAADVEAPKPSLATALDAPAEGAAEDGEAAKEEAPSDVAADAQIGTPMEERVATIGLLNKRNNLSQDIELKPGEEHEVGDVIIRLSACERTAPWEMPSETGAFLQMFVKARGENDFGRVFSGWLFKNSPSVNVVEHPIYDVWVKDCAMSFPGEEGPSKPAASDDKDA
ncbi:MAG: DUF2155 domain-containing protein [Marinomonas sp.]